LEQPVSWSRAGFHNARQEKRRWRYRRAGINAGTSGGKNPEHCQKRQPENFSMYSHLANIIEYAMMANTYSFGPVCMISIKYLRGSRKRSGLVVLLLFLLFPKPVWSQGVIQEKYRPKIAAEYHQAKTDYQSATNGSPAAWQFARACYNFAEFATNDDNRADLANEGIAACQKLLASNPKSGAAYYYLGMNQGQLARTEFLGALKLVRDMEREFKIAWSLDQTVDHGGPARSLGLLYQDAPGWPTSIGSKRKAREWMERSAQFDPIFPENFMVQIEASLKWDEPDAAREQLAALNKIWPQARAKFSGHEWEMDWADWTARRLTAHNKLTDYPVTPPPAKNSRRPN
jgi:hypothetical protein